MRRSWRQFLLLAVAAGILSCRSSLTACNLPLIPGLAVFVRDSATAASLVDTVTVVTVRDDAYLDTGEYHGDRFLAADGRPGVYTVVIQRAGYRDWLRQNVRVDGTDCGHPITVSLHAFLQANP